MKGNHFVSSITIVYCFTSFLPMKIQKSIPILNRELRLQALGKTWKYRTETSILAVPVYQRQGKSRDSLTVRRY